VILYYQHKALSREGTMIVTTVDVWVKPEHIADFIKATIANHESSIKENGSQRFDVLQSTEDPAHFLLYEAYKTDDQAAAHKSTAHYKAWKEAVSPWMAQPRQGTPYQAIRPE
jgi:(4S)-4-hydroxy-5-phosphonooxypentane-2,3-dione isomerase